jgi:PKD domain
MKPILAMALAIVTATGANLQAQPKPCTVPAPGAPMYVTGDCIDPRFNNPYVDIDEQRTVPVPHRYIHGGFKGTDAKFSFYFPPPEQFQGRFFQNTHQLLTSENGPAGNIGFAIASGAYYVQTNIGGVERATTTEQAVFGKLDPSIGGYRANAEAAKFSRVKAAELYGKRRIYGYLYGGSGGAFQTVSSAENTVGVWDGFVPYVMGSPNSIPGTMTVRIHALRVLKLRDKFPGIMDAIDPGGSGDPYAGLNAEESAALKEATRLGFPLRGWFSYATMNGGALPLVAGYVPYLDPTYTNDFWTKPGYLGTDKTSSVAAARIQQEATVVNVITGPQKRLELSSMPAGDLTGADLVVTSGASTGKSVALGAVTGKTAAFGYGADPAIVNGIQPGDKVRVDNSAYLALQTYHRHQVPSRDMYGWEQFRNSKGEPIYPQRSVLLGLVGSMNGAGSIQNGRFKGKMIVLESLMDIDALPWQADWYRTKVKEALGKRIDDEFRLYFNEHSQHTPPAGVPAQAVTVSYQGALEQALRDVTAWVEKGVKPPASTNYKVVDSQIEVPETAAKREGIQPVVHLSADGRVRADVAVGTPVTFTATIEVPVNGDKVVAAEWDFEGRGNYPVQESLKDFKSTVTLRVTHTFSQPGTYFPVLRATSQRDGDAKTPYARIQNLGRVRVVVN